MPRQKSRSPSTSPAKNTSANYQSAAREIEQEKQMVAALKRLSIGHLMDLDPDIPASDVSYSFFVDREASYEPDQYTDRPYSPVNGPERAEHPFEHKDSRPDPEVAVNKAGAQTHTVELQPDSKTGQVESSHEHTSPSKSSNGPSPEELLWVPANVHPEVNPHHFKSHVKTTFDEMLERKLSRSKSASRSKRSSLSLSTTDDHDEDRVNTTQEREETVELEQKRQNRLSNPSLRRLTSELQTMSRLAGMDSTDAVTLARSLSTSSLGYSEVEKSAIDEIEQANTYKNNASHAELADVGYEEHQPGPNHTYGSSNGPNFAPNMTVAEQNRRNILRSESPHRYSGNRPVNSGHGMNYGNESAEDFSLRRSRRVDYRKGPTTSSVGSQLQSNKAGKLAQLRQNLSSSNLSTISTHDRDRGGKHVEARTSMQSINPRSSQVLFSYKAPSQNSPPVHPQSLSARNTVGHGNSRTSSMGSFQSRDSPYMSASAPDSLEKSLQPTKYSQHNLTSMSLNQQGQSKPTLRIHNPNASPRLGQKQANNFHYKPSNEPRNNSGYRKESPTSPHLVNASPRVSSRENRDLKEGAHSGQSPRIQQSTQRYMPSNTAGRSPTQKHSPTLGSYSGKESYTGKAEPGNSRTSSKRTKSKELNQNLNLLRNEINEFKDSLASRGDVSKQKRGEDERSKKSVEKREKEVARESQKETKKETKKDFLKDTQNLQEAEHADFSFDLTHQDVSYDDSLGMESDVLAELASSENTSPIQNSMSNDSAEKHDEFVSVPDTDDAEDKYKHSHAIEESVIAKSGPFTRSGNTVSGMDEKGKEGEIVGMDGESVRKEDDYVGKEEGGSIVKGSMESQVTNPMSSQNTSKPSHHTQEGATPTIEVQKRQPVERKNTDENPSLSSPESSHNSTKTTDKKKAKKSWPWSKEKPSRAKETTEPVPKENRIPTRSVSSPEMGPEIAPKAEVSGKENAITKFFKKRRSTSETHDRSSLEPSSSKRSNDSLEEDRKSQDKTRNKRQSRDSNDDSYQESPNKELKQEKSNEESKHSAEHKVASRLKNRIKNMKKIHEEKDEKGKAPAENVVVEETNATEVPKPKSTLEVQEKLKKAIKRHSKPNQPIEFTDSAFGFPLPPPSSSTLVMIDYRFPVHVERAIYRLSHLKLANPKRSLREQVILSNFMYAYLNLVDHTLHLEQQMTEEYEVDQPDGGLDFLGDQDVDTEFEAEDDFEDEFDSIKIDLDVKENMESRMENNNTV